MAMGGEAVRSNNGKASELEAGNVQALLSAIELHDPYTAEHSRKTLRLADAVAQRLGLDHDLRGQVRLVAILHDVGKLGLPDRVLNKPAPLSPAERQVVLEHPAAGARVVSQVEELAHLAPAIRAGHERWDGGGYPDGLSGTDIPIASRITFVCDAYDAMTSERPYRRARSPEEAREELLRCRGTQFCALCVDALLEVLVSSESERLTAGVR
jgi:HD-GYP domain-containing protein (c-di-GMP phosphodiesterase class II)